MWPLEKCIRHSSIFFMYTFPMLPKLLIGEPVRLSKGKILSQDFWVLICSDKNLQCKLKADVGNIGASWQLSGSSRLAWCSHGMPTYDIYFLRNWCVWNPDVHVGNPCFLLASLPILLNLECGHHVRCPHVLGWPRQLDKRLRKATSPDNSGFSFKWNRLYQLGNSPLCPVWPLEVNAVWLSHVSSCRVSLSSRLVKKKLPVWCRWQPKNQVLFCSGFGIPTP